MIGHPRRDRAYSLAAQVLAVVAGMDPSHPDNRLAWPDAQTPLWYEARNAVIMTVAQILYDAEVPVGVGVDDKEPGYLVVYIELPDVGQVSWHLPARDDRYRLPTHPLAWDGHDVITKYERVSRWVRAQQNWAEPAPMTSKSAVRSPSTNSSCGHEDPVTN